MKTFRLILRNETLGERRIKLVRAATVFEAETCAMGWLRIEYPDTWGEFHFTAVRVEDRR